MDTKKNNNHLDVNVFNIDLDTRKVITYPKPAGTETELQFMVRHAKNIIKAEQLRNSGK